MLNTKKLYKTIFLAHIENLH